MAKDNEKGVFLVQEMDKKFIDRHPDNYEHYVLVQSKSLAKIYGKPFAEGIESEVQLDGLVKISAGGCRKVYRRIHAHTTEGLTGDAVQIASRTINRLGVKSSDTVRVSKACGFAYLWHHPDTSVRGAFQFAVCAFALTCVLTVIMRLI